MYYFHIPKQWSFKELPKLGAFWGARVFGVPGPAHREVPQESPDGLPESQVIGTVPITKGPQRAHGTTRWFFVGRLELESHLAPPK